MSRGSLNRLAINEFQARVWQHYAEHGRHDLPWRQPEADGSFDPYKIFVSELMLQQTQVPRVIPKYAEFLRLFPTLTSVAGAEQGDIIRAWSGLGYNRRAKYLWQTAQQLVSQDGKFPHAIAELVKFPGIGVNTAGAIAAYAFNEPAVFIETNIRTVFIHYFFPAKEAVPEADLRAVAAQTVDASHPRQWYWALMDYGSYLKHTVGNLNKQSKVYAKQPPFAGSRRQVRGAVLRSLAGRPLTEAKLAERVPSALLPDVLEALLAEGLVRRTKSAYHL